MIWLIVLIAVWIIGTSITYKYLPDRDRISKGERILFSLAWPSVALVEGVQWLTVFLIEKLGKGKP